MPANKGAEAICEGEHDDPIEEDMVQDHEPEPEDFEDAFQAPLPEDVPMDEDENDNGNDNDDAVVPDRFVETPLLPEEKLPTLDEYQQKWDNLYLIPTRAVKGNYSPYNLVPLPVPQLFQDCPWVPFDVLTNDDASDEAHARLACCFPLTGLQPSTMADGIERYAHCQGQVNFRRWLAVTSRILIGALH